MNFAKQQLYLINIKHATLNQLKSYKLQQIYNLKPVHIKNNKISNISFIKLDQIFQNKICNSLISDKLQQ